jgi:hypothetical protein
MNKKTILAMPEDTYDHRLGKAFSILDRAFNGIRDRNTKLEAKIAEQWAKSDFSLNTLIK